MPLDLQQFFFFGVAASFLFGLAFGSFLNVCIYRMPRELSVVRPRSACPHCHQPIRAYDNIPVLSWLILRGRCRNCKQHISPRYLFIEFVTGALFTLCFLRFGFSLETIKFCALSFLLLGLIATDFDCKLLPDRLTLPGLGIGLAFSLFVPMPALISRAVPLAVWQSVSYSFAWRAQSLLDSAFAAALGAFLIYAAGWLYLKLRGVEGMGFGDVKMMAMVGSFLGAGLTLFTIGGAALLASAFGISAMLVVWIKRTRRRVLRGHHALRAALPRAWVSAQLIYRHYEIPFGAFLGSVALLAFFYGEALIRWYMHLWMAG